MIKTQKSLQYSDLVYINQIQNQKKNSIFNKVQLLNDGNFNHLVFIIILLYQF